mgnify:CR=1 FL=1
MGIEATIAKFILVMIAKSPHKNLNNMIITITIFYTILDLSSMNEKELDTIDKEMDSNIRKCINNGFAVNNFQDRIFN